MSRRCPKCGHRLVVDEAYRHPKHGKGAWFVHAGTTETHLCPAFRSDP